MQLQKIKILLYHRDENYPKYQTKKWYIINDRNKSQYGEGEENEPPIKIDTEVVKPFLRDYASAFILAIGNITVRNGDANTKVAFKNCHPFTKSEIHLNDEHVESADNLDLIMNMYKLTKYSDNFSDSTASLCQYKRQEQNYNNGNIVDLATNDSTSFKYKSDLLGNATAEGGNAVWKNAQIIVPLKYILSFFRSLELSLINTKLYIQLNYAKNSVISSVVGVSTFKILIYQN